MIYCITFNPALDGSGEVDELIPDEKNYIQQEYYRPGGNGINAGIIAHRLRAPVLLSGFLGGANGKKIESYLTKNNIPHKFVPIKGETRMNFTVSNKFDHRQTRLSFLGPKILSSEKKSLTKFMNKIKEDDIVLLGGSLPLGMNLKDLSRLIKQIKKKKAICLVDMPAPFLKKAIHFRPDFIKPNLIEFQSLVNKKVKTIKSALPLARELLDFVPNICISSIEGGALFVTKDVVWFGKLPKVTIHSTVGAGDSMVGAMASLWSSNTNESAENLLRLGLAASCASLTEKGLTLGSRRSMLYYKSKMILRKI